MGAKFFKYSILVLAIIISCQIFFQYYLLFQVAEGRYKYHVDNLWRALGAYKWSLSPFFTWDPAKLPLEYAIYGLALKIWPDIPLTLASVNIFFSAAITVFIFLLGARLSGSEGGGLISAFSAAFIPSFLLLSVGIMAEIIMILFLSSGFYFYFLFRDTLDSPDSPPGWSILYLSAICFLAASATRPEAWFFTVAYLFLLSSLFIRRTNRSDGMTRGRIHIIISFLTAFLFIPAFLIHGYLVRGNPFHIISYYGSTPLSSRQLPPRLIVYPLILFKTAPLPSIFLAVALCLAVFKKLRAGRQYILSLAIAFLLLTLSSLIFFSYLPERAAAAYAVLSCPLGGIIVSRVGKKNKTLFVSLCVLIVFYTFFIIPGAVKPIQKYHDTVIKEGDYDKVGRFLKSIKPQLENDEVILVELTDEWREYYLFYYLPDNLAFDKSGKWCRPWRRTLFPTGFHKVYLGYEKMTLDKSFSLFDLPIKELSKLFKEKRVGIIIARSPEIISKMEELFQHKIRIGDYILLSNRIYRIPGGDTSDSAG